MRNFITSCWKGNSLQQAVHLCCVYWKDATVEQSNCQKITHTHTDSALRLYLNLKTLITICLWLSARSRHQLTIDFQEKIRERLTEFTFAKFYSTRNAHWRFIAGCCTRRRRLCLPCRRRRFVFIVGKQQIFKRHNWHLGIQRGILVLVLVHFFVPQKK